MNTNIYSNHWPTWVIVGQVSLLLSCASAPVEKPRAPEPQVAAAADLHGQEDAQVVAHVMFSAIGGQKNWARLGSLYIKARHTQPDGDNSYQSEIWRDLKETRFRIEQQNEDWHKVAIVDARGAWIDRNDGKGFVPLSEEVWKNMMRSDAINIYKLLRRVAAGEPIELKLGRDDRLELFEDGKFLAAFELDDENRPHRFIQPGEEGEEEVISEFPKWGQTGALIHPVQGGPIDKSFEFQDSVWKLGEGRVEASFDASFDPQ